MSGLFVRSHMNAGQDDFRDESSKQMSDLVEGHWGIRHVRHGGSSSPWLTELLKRKSPKLAAVALANKMARTAWKLMVTGENYAATAAPAALAGAA